MAYNPNAVFISHSSLGDYDKCPRLYYLRNVYKSPETGFKLQLINPALALGQVVHEVFELFTNLDPDQRTWDQLPRILSDQWITIKGEKGGFKNSEEEEEHRKRAETMIKRFFENSHFKTTVKAKIPRFPKAELGDDLILTGKLDWIEADEDGYHVIDFKTGQNEEREDSMQLPIYALLASSVLKSNKLKTSYWYVDKEDALRPYELPDMEEFSRLLKQKAMIIKKARLTNSLSCSRGGKCWACKDMEAVFEGRGKLVSVDSNRKQEICILKEENPKDAISSDMPF